MKVEKESPCGACPDGHEQIRLLSPALSSLGEERGNHRAPWFFGWFRVMPVGGTDAG
jgi:hypothetical protein